MSDQNEKPDFAEILRDLIDKGLLFSDCVAAFVDDTEYGQKMGKLAHDQYHAEGEIEIDLPALLSGSDDNSGDYVMAWVWVYDPDADEDENEA